MFIGDDTPIADIIAEYDNQMEVAFNAAVSNDLSGVREALEAAEIAIRHLRLLQEWNGAPLTPDMLLRRARQRRMRNDSDYIPF